MAGSWTGTSPRGVYKPTIAEDPGDTDSGAWKNFDTSLTNIHNKLWRDNVINVKSDYEATGDGSTDDSTNFQSAATAAAGGILWVPKGFTFVISNITISADTTIMGGGKLKLLVLGATVASPILDIRGANVTIDGIKFDGQKASQPADGFSDSFDGGANGQGRAFRAAIKADGVAYTITNLNVRNCFFENVYGACIATDDVDEVYVRDNIAENCNFEIAFLYNNAGVTAPLDAIVTGNRGYNIGSGDGSVNGNAFSISNYTRVIFDNNQVDTVERNLVKIEGGNQIEITNNIGTNVTKSNFPAIQVQGTTTDLLIEGNVSKTTGKGIQIGGGASYSYNRIKVANNICSDINGTTLGDGFACDSPINDAQIENNQFYDVQRHGIHFNHSGSRVSIKNNKLYGDGTDGDIGIYVTADGANFADLTIEENECWNFTQAVASLGVIELRRSSTYVFTNLTMRRNKVFAGGASNRGIYIGTANIISSGLIEGNYVDGLIYLNENTANNVKVVNNYTTGLVTSGHITSGTVTLDTYGCTRLHSTGGAITATLPDGMEVGQTKTIVMTNATNASTVTVTNHNLSDGEVFDFDAVDDVLVLMWQGTEWITLSEEGVGVNHWAYGAELADEASINLPFTSSATGAKISVSAYNATTGDEQGGEVIMGNAMILVSNTANFVNTDTDAKLCILYAAQPTVKNRLGNTIRLTVTAQWF